MEAAFSTESSIAFQQTTQRYILEERTLNNQRCENPKSYTALKTCKIPSGATGHFQQSDEELLRQRKTLHRSLFGKVIYSRTRNSELRKQDDVFKLKLFLEFQLSLIRFRDLAQALLVHNKICHSTSISCILFLRMS
jgi:hypothetical protein